MEIRLAYRKAGTVLDVPDSIETDRFGLTQVEEPVTYSRFIESLSEAGGDKKLTSGNPLIVVNDAYRSTPTELLLTWLDDFDHTILDRARFLIATGAHAAPSPEQLAQVFGPHLERVRSRVSWHDCRDAKNMIRVGTDRFGCDVWLNRQVVEAQSVFIVGSVEPHYFAGFTGGRKSLFPGLTDLATIERNHNLANSLEAQPLRLSGNPVAEHLDQLLSLVDLDRFFTAQIVMDAERNIAGIFCGRLDRAFGEAIATAAGLYGHRVSDRYDMAIAVLNPPLDGNLYQAQKALENCQAAVVDGGAAVVVSACEEGIGSKFFFELAKQWDRKANRAADGVVRFGSHKLSRVNAMGKRIEVRLLSDLPDEHARQVFYEPIGELQRYVTGFFNNRKDGRLAVVHDAGHTVLQTINAS
ncbi:MAG: DUF2088 domain-containing protein [bacterium]|nr:DUF2088 domain-containing protein [bacterium]